MNLWYFIWFYLWSAPHFLLLAVAVVMYRKGMHKTFPIFFSYLLFEFLEFCLLFMVPYLKVPVAMYVKIDLVDRAGGIALHYGIFQELFEAPLAHSTALRRDAVRIMRWVTITLIVLASLSIGTLYSSIFGHRFPQAYTIVETLNAAQCGGLVLVFLWHRFLGLRMSSSVFGIALGMGLVVGFEPLMLALKTLVAVPSGRIVDIASMIAYHVAVLIWLYYAQAREKNPSISDAALPQLIEQAADMGRIVHL